jgi:hypothetical protein
VPSYMIEKFKESNLVMRDYLCGGYTDKIAPMRYIFLAITNNNGVENDEL